ncbi:hypothetical protein [Streptomyces sp. enrichment culture]|uniref:hypothetical protein n=1 Tax=Streptomyces sp. enrichment culture TaxID=1795815 RepID=UPI003F56B4E1
MRASVRRRDPRFLAATPELAAALAVAEDDGRDLLAHVPAHWKEIKTWAKRFLPPAKLSPASPNSSANPSPRAS